MAEKQPQQQNQPAKKKSGFFSEITGAINDVVKEVKADIAAMTPPDGEAKRRQQERDAAADRATRLAQSATSGIYEEYDENTPPPEESTEEKKPLSQELPAHPWKALSNPTLTTLMHADACFHALTPTDIENYRKALPAEKTPPYTLGLIAVNIQAPLEGEDTGAGEGAPTQSDDILLASLLGALAEPRLYGAVGAGPRQLWHNLEDLDARLTALINDNPKLIAIGPIGIDEPYAPYQVEQQKRQFALQLEIAADFNLPAIINHRNSVPFVVEVLASMNGKLPPLVWLDVLDTEDEAYVVKRFNMHALLRPEVTTPDFIGGSYYRNLPQERLLLASGSALVAPHGFSGHFNQPRFLRNTLTSSSKILVLHEKEVIAITNLNLANLFGQGAAAEVPVAQDTTQPPAPEGSLQEGMNSD